MTSYTINGNNYSSDGTGTRDMLSGGHRTWLLPMLGDAVIVAGQAAADALTAAGHATTTAASASAAATSATAAAASATAAGTSATNAASSASAAAASAAAASAITGLPLISGSADAGKVISVDAGGSGYVLAATVNHLYNIATGVI